MAWWMRQAGLTALHYAASSTVISSTAPMHSAFFALYDAVASLHVEDRVSARQSLH
jgi:hypothetical protein